MAKDGTNWEGLLKWSLAHSDGTGSARNLSEEDRRWFMEAMQAQSIDVIKRMKEITLVMQTPEQVLESQGVTPADIEASPIESFFQLMKVLLESLNLFNCHANLSCWNLDRILTEMLDELQEHVESIDMANDLHSIGGLVPLLGYLKNSHANIRAKAADVVTTVVQNNPRSQQLVMEANGFEPLVTNFSSDPDLNVRTKALGAISSLIQHNKPGIAAFRLANGYAALRDALISENVRFQRKALNLIHYLLQENSADCNIVNELGFPRIMMHLASSEDPAVREAALRGLLDLARDKEDGFAGKLGEDDEKMKQLLQERIDGISLMSSEDLGAAMEERQLVDSLWSTCFNEPSSLREKGLLVLPGEDEPAPDVASKHFEPPLRAWAPNPSKKDSSSDKKAAPLLLGPGVPPATNNQVSSRREGDANVQADDPSG